MTFIVYWSGTGNTQKMAEAIYASLDASKATLVEFEATDVATVAAADVIAFGCPAMGDEELEESVVRPFMDDIAPLLKGKSVGLFGSYQWADGQWMETWEDEVRSLGATIIDTLPVYDEPTDNDLAKCREFGHALAQKDPS
ncbi:flavodoxin [Peptoniphilus equinus]|uniref:Flavodoxin n=1 Tax=Peptoniphilus equinus TaxID=3016343 RepID=A0ABY7QT30_9FIRM|nr:flavodoxin [Peptoniphilus equinus]WBW49929.1 flavodoxin [Peptoniphilus equinus]